MYDPANQGTCNGVMTGHRCSQLLRKKYPRLKTRLPNGDKIADNQLHKRQSP
jgi:hypothetical protein